MPWAETGRSDPDFRSGFLSHRASDSSRALRNHCRGLASAESKGDPDAIAMVLREFRLPDGESGFHPSGLFLPGQVRGERHFGSDQSVWRDGDWNGFVRIALAELLDV